MTEPAPITLAAITGAHGVRGEVRLKLFAESEAGFRAYGRYRAGERELVLKNLKRAGKTLVARFEGVSTREAAEALRGTALTVDRAALPPLEEGEIYVADLVGRPVEAVDGTKMGRVHAVENYGAGDILDIELADGKRVMLPFTADAVPSVDTVVRINPAYLPD
ncbi:ribosome maturation factor RimM [Pacificimonas sp. ICDLI1SI03]